jgi:hypothetical protein
MAVLKRPPLPVILVANDLLDGDVVYAAAAGWTRDPRLARLAHDDAEADALERFGASEFLHAHVVDPYLVDVKPGADGVPAPRHYREALRMRGPSVRSDLGKQADFEI